VQHEALPYARFIEKLSRGEEIKTLPVASFHKSRFATPRPPA